MPMSVSPCYLFVWNEAALLNFQNEASHLFFSTSAIWKCVFISEACFVYKMFFKLATLS